MFQKLKAFLRSTTRSEFETETKLRAFCDDLARAINQGIAKVSQVPAPKAARGYSIEPRCGSSAVWCEIVNPYERKKKMHMSPRSGERIIPLDSRTCGRLIKALLCWQQNQWEKERAQKVRDQKEREEWHREQLAKRLGL